ncbi:DUF2256 domain-containing protein [Marinobacterium stanieri]|uniref:DUF2256 domain-containing protein n=1 Tax=Marinobacterium stanieri TaxID=49186 RepID=UPI000C1E1844
MPRMKRKGDLPEKICPACQRPFSWRRKWAHCWDEVRYCSQRCRSMRQPKGDSAS